MLVLPLMFLILVCLMQVMIRGRILLKRDGKLGATKTKRNHANDPIGPITRARKKKLKEALNGLVQNI